MSNNSTIAFISPALPPDACGVGDFADLLARHWPTETSRDLIHLVAARSTELGRTPAVLTFGNRPGLLLQHLESQRTKATILHYTARAYHPYGMPFWIVRTLTGWRRAFPDRRLLVYFHELWSESIPRTSKQYPLQLANRHICRQLLLISDVGFTNTQKHADQLNGLKTATPVTWQPVSANIPVNATSDIKRREWLVFGLALSRSRTLQQLAPWLTAFVHGNLLETLHMVGPRESALEAEEEHLFRGVRDRLRIVRHGLVDSSEVSRLISCAEFCFDAQAAESITKSGVFMAYAAHGAQVVSRQADLAAVAPYCYLIHPRELIEHAGAPLDVGERCERLKVWYECNASWDVTAPQVAEALSVTRRRLVIITTNLPPVVCGIGDHTVRLLEAVSIQRPLTFILPERGPTLPHRDEDNRNVMFSPPSASALKRILRSLGPCDVFVQYSGYGYHGRGYPRWLVTGLCAWRRERAGHLAVFFHELWSRPSKWKPHAAIEWLHRMSVARLASAADRVFTNTDGNALDLKRHARGCRADVLAVGSNIEAPLELGDPCASHRRGVVVLLGRHGTRSRVLKCFGSQLASIAAQGRFRRLLLIGGEGKTSSDIKVQGLSIENLGHLATAEVSNALLSAEFGLTDEGLKGFTKSGVCAAYAAHRLPILSSDSRRGCNEPFASLTHTEELLQTPSLCDDEIRARAERLRQWYVESADWTHLARVLSPVFCGV